MGALQITIPRWNITEMNGYEPITTFWQDFSIADKFGNNAVADTYRRAKSEWKDNYKYWTELCHVLIFASYAVAALDGGIGQVGIQELRGLECLVGYLCLFCIEEVKDEIGCAQQRNIQYGRKHIFGLPEIDFLEYPFHRCLVWVGSTMGATGSLWRSLSRLSCISVALLVS